MAPPVLRTTDELMADQAARPARGTVRMKPEHEIEHDEKKPNPGAPEVSQWPPATKTEQRQVEPKIHTTGLSFDGATLTDTGAFPPDTMGAVGPTQFFAFENGRLRTFTKAGVADGVINADPDVFFASVMTPVAGAVVLNFTSDPNVRYDRISGRWFLTIIDVPCTNATCTTTAANRLLIAVSDAASNGTLSGSTVWSFFQFQGDPGTNFLDYPSLGIDVNALYIGGNMFSSAGSFVGTNGYVAQKSSILAGGPVTVTMFANLASGTGAGPLSPRGVDNFDPGATEGYFVGVDNAAFSLIQFRRVSNPGSATPTISANISVTVPTTTFPNRVEHAGNTGGANGGLDSLDDRLYAAMIRNGRLWTAHNFRVSAAGVANTAAASRNASRWYEFQNLTTTPTLVQSGTVFDNAATRAAARQYFIPSVLVTGQGHAVLGFTMAGTPVGATPAYVGRLAGDTLGTMTGPPTVAAVTFGTTTANYNPAADPGGASGRRWGDYSFTSLDPLDDMTIWTIQEYNQALNSYAVRIGKLLAPPPATPTCSGSPITFTGPTGNVVINATSSGGSGFYDPGPNLPAPALPFNHLSATVTNATVNSVTYNSPTQATLNITALTNGLQNVTITNPDGQSVTANSCINVLGAAVADLSITKTDGVATAVPGGSVTYTVTASNASATAATGATVADTFPAILTCNWTCVGAGGGTCTASGSGNISDSVNLPAGASVTYTATCAINASATGTLSNTATVTLAGDPNAANNSATDTDTLTPAANLGITKTDGVTTVTAGGSATYTITASNAGPSNAPGATVADTFPASLTCTWTCVGAGGGTCTASGSGNISDTVNLPSGGSVTYTASCTISAAATGTLSNTATVAAPGGVTDPTPGNNSATDSDTIGAQADLSITKTDGVTTATPGGSVTYTITASNAGPSNASGATVADTFPASLTCTWTCVGAGGGTCTASGSGNINNTVNLPAGGSVTYTASCTVSAAATGTLSNTATVSAPGGVTDPTPGNNSATDTDTLGAQADLAITKTDGVATATPGGSVTYTITASNAGPSNASGATVADTFPASLTCTWTCVGAGGGTCTASGSGNINNTVNLPAGGSVTYTASCAVSAAATGTLSNTATVAAPGGVTDPTPGNNSATDTDTLTPQANLGITKTDGVTTVTAGGSTTYTITASNAGPGNAPGATVSDTFPAALTCTWTCVGAGGGTCTASGSGNINNTVNLPAGGSVTYTASCTISAAASGTISNTATVSAPGGVTDPTPGNNSATDTDTIGCPAITINPAILPSGQFGVGYNQTLTGSGGATPYNFSLANGSSLPPGLALAANGIISGTPTATGTTTFTVNVADANNCTGNRTYTIAIQCPTINIAPATLPNPQAGVAYSQMLTGSGGVGPYNFALHAGSSLPPGLTLAGNVISGTPTVLGTTTFTIDVTDTGLAVGPTNCSGNRTYTVTVVCPSLTLNPATLPNAAFNTAYPTTLSVSPGGGNYTFALTNGVLPQGLTLNSDGTFGGAPTQSGTFNFRVTATGFGSCSVFRDYVLVVDCPTITVNPATLPDGIVGTSYSQTVSAAPAGAYNFVVTSGAMPLGLTLNASTGTLSGMPTSAGTFNFRVSASLNGCSGSRDYTLVITCSSASLTPSVLPAGQAGTPYNQTVSVNPPGSYTFSLTAGNLPAGLTLNATTGVISGTPTVTGTTTFTLQAQTATGCAGTQTYTLIINCPTVTVNPASLLSGSTGVAYSQSFSAVPAGGNYSFAVTAGTLPTGLNLNPATGVLSGTPTANGTFTFTVTASGWGSCAGSRQYSVLIGTGACPVITLPSLPGTGTVGQIYTAAVSASPAGVYSYAVTTGALPPGLSLFSPFGTLYGYPTAMGTYNFTVMATDSSNCTASQGYTIVIGAGAAVSLRVFSDFDGDGKNDLSVLRRSDNHWLVTRSSDGKLQTTEWGAIAAPYNDLAASGDYDGDGKTDLAVFRRGTGYWYIKRSSDGQTASKLWGVGTDLPVAGDYDGDGKTDIAVWRGSEGNWYIHRSSDGGSDTIPWGAASVGDLPVPGDYDGDGKTDVAVFRRSTGYWHVKLSSNGQTVTKLWGVGTDVPVAGDYDGDGKTDIAVWRGSDTNWYIVLSGNNSVQTVSWGTAAQGDVAVPGDYDGDGKTDVAVWREAGGMWYVKLSGDGSVMSAPHGQSGDLPVMARRN